MQPDGISNDPKDPFHTNVSSSVANMIGRRAVLAGTGCLLFRSVFQDRISYAASEPDDDMLIAVLAKSYPDFISGGNGREVVWHDGDRMVFDDGVRAKAFEALLNSPSIRDMFYARYPLGTKLIPPGKDIDPGRVRNEPFFDKMYGDCTKGEVKGNLTNITWLPKKLGKTVSVTKVNNVDKELGKVSQELDALPARFDKYLSSSGTFNCRVIAGTKRKSNHGSASAIDINAKFGSYWRWDKPDSTGLYKWRNEIPLEIVEIFESHGFIWGGKWYHYDTLHFEYRPELIMASKLY